MENLNNGYSVEETNTLKDYINLVRNNFVPVLIITIVSAAAGIFYALNATDIYVATTSLKISKPSGSILEGPIMPEFQDFGSDRFIANEIEIMKSYNVRSRVAKALYDSVNNDDEKYASMLNKDFQFTLNDKEQILTLPEVASLLEDKVAVEQKRGLDIVEISVESPSPKGAEMMANIYAQEYRNLNLEQNRNQLTLVKNFLEQQRSEKLSELKEAEELLSDYQEKGGIIALDEQASTLISTLAQFEAQKNAAQIELSASNKVLAQYKQELEKQNPKLVDYLESVSSESYFKSLQEQIAKLELNRDMALSNSKSADGTAVKEYDKKIKELRKKLDEKLEVIKAGIFASSPEEVKELSQKILTEETKNQTLRTSLSELSAIVDRYDERFNKLPKTSIELARFQRSRESLEKLYTLVEEKYQEALINEQSQPGNVLIVDKARVPEKPAKPNRLLIIVIGFVLGGGLSFAYVFIKNYFDNTIKTPEDIQNRNMNVLAWIPQIEGITKDNKEFEFIVARKPDSIPAEAFKALRTRVQFSKLGDKSLKSILVTSSTPQEGKTTISVNLAASFAQANKRTAIIDCDLRKPRLHTMFNASRYPGLIDHLFGQVTLEEIVRESEVNNLYYITSGTIPPNPSEMLSSDQMQAFLNEVRERFDIVILDSPPIVAVTDSEIISSYVDATILVASSEKTELVMLEKSVELIRHENSSFIGVVLNNFSYKAGYGAYYKYYYYYTQPTNGKAKDKAKEKA